MRTPSLVLSLILALGFSSPSPASASSPAPASPRAAAPVEWPHPGYDAEDSYYNPHESAITLGTIPKLKRSWTVQLRKQAACAGFSAPLVAAGRVIATDQYGISAYTIASGAPSWHFNWPDPVGTETPSMAVDGTSLILGTSDCFSQSDPDGMVVALDLTSGRVRWQAKTDIPVYSLAVDKGVAVISGSSPSDAQTTIAYRIADGKVAWRKAGLQTTNVSANGRLLLTDTHNTSAVAIKTGALLWTKPGFWLAKAATPTSDRFLVTSGQSLLAVNAASGAVMWTAKGAANELLATDGWRVFRVVGKVIEALSVPSGRSLWSRTLPKPPAQPVRAGDVLYLGGPILNPVTGVAITPAYPGAEIVTAGRLVVVNNGTLSSYAS